MSAGTKFTPAAVREDQIAAPYFWDSGKPTTPAAVRCPVASTNLAYSLRLSTTMVRAPSACKVATLVASVADHGFI
jgi:hypothetical protein